jgi:hypothetical protein
MRVLSVASCSLATLAVWNLNQRVTASPNPELLIQSTPGLAEDIAIPAKNPPPQPIQAIAPPEVINSSPQSGHSSSQQKTIVEQSNLVIADLLVPEQQKSTVVKESGDVVVSANMASEESRSSMVASFPSSDTPLTQNSTADALEATAVLATAANVSVSAKDLALEPIRALAPPEAITSPRTWSAGKQDSLIALEPARADFESLSSEVSPATNSPPLISDDSAENTEESPYELGEIQIIDRPQPDVQLLLRSSGFLNPDTAALINSALLLATPKLGPETSLVASVGGGLQQFRQVGGSDFYFLNFSLGVRQKLARDTYGQLGWVQERLYETGTASNVVDDSIRLSVDREDNVAAKLRLNSFYELRASFARGGSYDQSRIANTLGARLRYDFTPQLEGALDYRIVADSFTNASVGTTVRQQLSALATYRFNRHAFVTGSVSYVLGSAIDPFDGFNRLNTFVLGVSAGLNVF